MLSGDKFAGILHFMEYGGIRRAMVVDINGHDTRTIEK